MATIVIETRYDGIVCRVSTEPVERFFSLKPGHGIQIGDHVNLDAPPGEVVVVGHEPDPPVIIKIPDPISDL